MATTWPTVPAKLECDLGYPNTASAQWVDASGQVRSLSGVRLEYVPYLVGNEGDDRTMILLGNVTAINVDREKHYEVGRWPGALPPLSEFHAVAHWRRAPWGELIRFRPE